MTTFHGILPAAVTPFDAAGEFNLAGCIVGGTMAALAGALKSAIGLGGALQVSAVLLLVAALVLWHMQPVEPPRVLATA